MGCRTGVTGYIGGDILYTIAYAHPEYEITALVRNSEKGARVAQEYPRVRLVYGDNETRALIEEETKKADIVMRKYWLSLHSLHRDISPFSQFCPPCPFEVHVEGLHY